MLKRENYEFKNGELTLPVRLRSGQAHSRDEHTAKYCRLGQKCLESRIMFNTGTTVTRPVEPTRKGQVKNGTKRPEQLGRI
jgi:hypothetical protein